MEGTEDRMLVLVPWTMDHGWAAGCLLLHALDGRSRHAWCSMLKCCMISWSMHVPAACPGSMSVSRYTRGSVARFLVTRADGAECGRSIRDTATILHLLLYFSSTFQTDETTVSRHHKEKEKRMIPHDFSTENAKTKKESLTKNYKENSTSSLAHKYTTQRLFFFFIFKKK